MENNMISSFSERLKALRAEKGLRSEIISVCICTDHGIILLLLLYHISAKNASAE